MANIIIFHSVLGVRKGVLDLADRLEDNGHRAYCVDLYDGISFDDMDRAMEFFMSIGIPQLIERTITYTQDLPNDSIYIGFSNGGASAMLLAGTKPHAMGCVLLHAALPLEELGIEKWPSDVPVQIHYAAADPWKEQSSIDALERDIREAGASYAYYEYPVEGHLFTDSLLPEYNEEASELLISRVLDFISRVE